MSKASLEFTTRQIVILILMLLIAGVVIFIVIRYNERIKDIVLNLLATSDSLV